MLTVLADGGFWITQALNSLLLGMLLFLLSVGLTVILGLMNFVNLAHGALYAIGAYLGYSIAILTGSYWLALLLAPLAVATIGFTLHAALLFRLGRAGPMNQVLVTFGLLFAFLDAIRYLWGADELGLAAPPIAGAIHFLGMSYPLQRLFLIVVGLVVYVVLHFLLERSRLGAEIRAGVDNAEIAAAMGINVSRTFLVVFALGCGLAGLAGALALAAYPLEPGMGVQILVPTLVVVVIGGLGSLKGAFWASLLIGGTLTFGRALVPELAAVAMYLLLLLVLVFRPAGLYPVRN